MERKTNKQIAKEFAKKVLKGYPDAKVILFGSRATENFLEESDYDFVIISKKFESMRFFERTEDIYKYWNHKEAIEPLCYTPEEYEQKKSQINIVQEAAAKGIQIM